MLAMLLNWKAKLAILVFAIAAAYGWHYITLENAVENAIQYVQYENYKYTVKLQEQNRETKEALELENKRIREEADEKLKLSDGKYRDLSEWVRKQPKLPTTTSGSNSANSTADNDKEDISEDVIGRLRRSHAQDLAGYAKVTQDIAIELKMCYDWNDSVRKIVDDHNSRITKIK